MVFSVMLFRLAHFANAHGTAHGWLLQFASRVWAHVLRFTRKNSGERFDFHFQ